MQINGLGILQKLKQDSINSIIANEPAERRREPGEAAAL